MERKRVSAGHSHQSKRARCRSIKQLSETYDKIDGIPSRSTTPLPATDGWIAPTREQTKPTVISRVASSDPNMSFTSSTSISTGTSSTAIVSHNSSFSPIGNLSVASSRNTSFSTDIVPSPEGSPEGSPSDYHTSQEWLTDSDFEIEPRLASHKWQRRLRGVFPKFANGNFNNAPLPVVWDITRCALHCGAKLDETDIPYGEAEEWLRQEKLRENLLQHKVFKRTPLPEATSNNDWNNALNPCLSDRDAIRYTGEMVPNSDPDGPLFTLKLNPLHAQTSNRLNRRFGSDRFLEISMPSMSDVKKATGCPDDSIAEWWIKGEHYFLGRQWSVFFCKRDDVKTKKRRTAGSRESWYTFILFACNGDSFRTSPDGSLPPHEDAKTLDRRVRVSLFQMMSWMIGDLKTTNQQVPKLFSRISLSLTSTTATVVLNKSQIHHCSEDIGEFPMNDGIGRMSPSLARNITLKLGLNDVPCAFQGRFGSAKGMWVVDKYTPPDIDDKDGDWIVTYPSQRKWECSYDDAHHRTLEIHSWPKKVKPATLNQQFIVLLEAQAEDPTLMRAVLAKHLRNGLLASLNQLKDAMDDPLELLSWLQQQGGSRSDAAVSPDDQAAVMGGLPQRKEDIIACLVDAGFVPRECQFLKEQCWQLGQQMAKKLETKMNIQVPCMAYLPIVVDFDGVLEENEVHVSFSDKYQVEGFSDTQLEGMDILVGRVPAHLPSDIQRVRVVSHPRLRHLKDVIVFSIKGKRPLADKLSGGDYDGDKALICWAPDIVENFRNAPPDFAQDVQPPKLDKFDLPMSQVREEARTEDEICERLVYDGIMFNMQQPMLGLCTNYKEELCRIMGSVSSPKIILLSTLLGFLVDQAKQGFIFTEEDWHALLKAWDLPMPQNLRGATGKNSADHILKHLEAVARTTVNAVLTDLHESMNQKNKQWYDADLTSRFNAYDRQHGSNPEWKQLRDKLREDIEAIFKEWSSRSGIEDANDKFADTVKYFHDKFQQIRPLEQLDSSPFIRTLLQDGIQNPHYNTWALLKASYAMTRYQRSNSKFVWYVAGLQLCRLKLDTSCGQYRSVRSELHAARRVDKKAVARRRARRADEEDELQDEDPFDEEADDGE
ncbi:hypothetical protein E4U53_002956 [Claviceps sorghi]|nr:hypothetical protein E4U53_002956 [Claviceps sorghi]